MPCPAGIDQLDAQHFAGASHKAHGISSRPSQVSAKPETISRRIARRRLLARGLSEYSTGPECP